MKFLIIFFFLTTSVFANVDQVIENLVINKELKKYNDLTFLDVEKKELNLDDFRGSLISLNFWATWCEPCKEEMPSLDILKTKKELLNALYEIEKDAERLDETYIKSLVDECYRKAVIAQNKEKYKSKT